MELRKARAVTADGNWHDYETLVRLLVPLVTPGRAARAAETSRAGQARRRAEARGLPVQDRPPRVRPVDPDRLRESGARTIIRKMLHDNGFEFRTGAGGRRQVRNPAAAGAD